MSKYLVEKISTKKVISSNHKYNRIITKFIKKYYLCIGSILSAASENSIVWGSGILNKNENVKRAKFCAVRGPETRKRLLELGCSVPEIYGDPALLLPLYLKNTVDKKYELAVIPHFVDYDIVNKILKEDNRIKVINLLTNDIERTTKEILECKQVISSSLHGVIVGQAYNIPALWVKFSNKLSGDNIKFYDYYKSVSINFLEEIEISPMDLSFDLLFSILDKNRDVLLPQKAHIQNMQSKLLKACPFN
ncbi:polysaccharide pyruvyl transferase family protein [Mariniflexile gromovii]|nr:polysaccharide pyruvyl transferase family protein [Mariniflexile gromovii]